MKPEIILKPYMAEQIKLEEQHYDRLYPLLVALLAMLDSCMRSRLGKDSVINVRDRFLSHRYREIMLLNKEHATNMIKLVGNTIPSVQFNHTAPTMWIMKDLDVNSNNLIHEIVGRYLLAIPVGIALLTSFGLPYLQGDDGIEELRDRSTNALKRYVQNSTSQGVSNTISSLALAGGYTEYVGQNEHDDRVRPQHRIDNDGVTWHKINRPPESGTPGTEYNCRCYIIKMR